MTKRKPGRPKGSKSIIAEVMVQPSRCPKCGSSLRTNYVGTQRIGMSGDGFTVVIRRRCRCKECGLQRVDREPEFRRQAAA